MSREARRTSSAGPAEPDYGIPPSGYRLPSSTRLGPVRLRVSDLARSEEFYGRVLGLEARDRDGGRVSLGAAGGDEALVELVERPGVDAVGPRGGPGLYHFALLLPDRADLGRFVLHARALHARMGMADHGVSEAVYLRDPDGLGVEVYADRPRDEWRTRGRQLVMTTEPLDFEDVAAGAGEEPFDGLSPGAVVGHVHLRVGDLERAAGFYHDALGFDKVVWDYPGALFLSAGGYHHHVGTNVWAGGERPAGPDHAGLVSWTLAVPTPEDEDRVAASLESAGVRVAPGGAHGGVLARDPWGSAVEVLASSDPLA